MQKFSQRDVERAVKGAINAGITIGQFEIRSDGTIVVIAAAAEPINALDDELEKWRRANDKH